MNKLFSGVCALLLVFALVGCAQPVDKTVVDPTIDSARAKELGPAISSASLQAMSQSPYTASVAGSKVVLPSTYVYENPDGAGTITVSISNAVIVSDYLTGGTFSLEFKMVYDGFEVTVDGNTYELDGTILMAANYVVDTTDISITKYDSTLVEMASDFKVSSGDYSDTFDIDMKYTMHMTRENAAPYDTTTTYTADGTIGSFTIHVSGSY